MKDEDTGLQRQQVTGLGQGTREENGQLKPNLPESEPELAGDSMEQSCMYLPHTRPITVFLSSRC